MNLNENLTTENLEINGRVQKTVLKQYNFDKGLQQYQDIAAETTIMHFNIHGNCTEYEVKYGEVINPDVWGVDFDNYREEYFYDENRLLKKKIRYDENNLFYGSSEFQYDSTSNLLKVTHTYSNFTDYTIHYAHIYDQKKKEKVIVKYDKDKTCIGKEVLKMDEDGRIIEERSYNQTPILIRRKTYSYYSDHTVYEYFIFDSHSNLEFKEITKQDLQGRVLEKCSYSKDNILRNRLTNLYKDDQEIYTNYNFSGEIVWRQQKIYCVNGRITELIIYNSALIIESHSRFIRMVDEKNNEIYCEQQDILNDEPVKKYIKDIKYYQ